MNKYRRGLVLEAEIMEGTQARTPDHQSPRSMGGTRWPRCRFHWSWFETPAGLHKIGLFKIEKCMATLMELSGSFENIKVLTHLV